MALCKRRISLFNRPKLGMFLLILYLIYNLGKEEHISKWNRLLPKLTRLQPRFVTKPKGKEFLINSTTCQLEKIDTFDSRFPEIGLNFMKKPAIGCDAEPLSTFKYGWLSIDPTLHRERYTNVTRCYYKPFDIEIKSFDQVTFQSAIEIDLKKGNKIDHPWVLVECTSKNSTRILYRNFHSQIVPHKDFYGIPIQDSNPDDFNVMIVLLESVSRLSWLRHAEDIHQFIIDRLGGILLNAHHVVGPNSFPNLYAIFRGRSVMSDMKNILFGEIRDHFIFSDFAKKGYATLVVEDVLNQEIPIYYKAKFTSLPTLHTDRPFKNLYRTNAGQYIPDNNIKQLRDIPRCYGERNIANQSKLCCRVSCKIYCARKEVDVCCNAKSWIAYT